MKVIYDNIIYSLQKNGGISVVWSNLISRIIKKNGADVNFIDYKNSNQNCAREQLSLPIEKINWRSDRFINIKRFINPNIHLPEKFIFHSSYFRTCNSPNAINITTVHDFIYQYFCKNYLKKTIHCRQMYKALRKSDFIVCISENTKKDLLKLLPDCNPSKIAVIYNGVSDIFHYNQDLNHENFILFIGKRKGYKNFEKIIGPVSQTKKELILVGPELTKKEMQLLQASNCAFKQLGTVSDQVLNTLYNKAFCLLYPSAYEGFGLPVIEAQKAGCPVIAYHSSSIPEIIGDETLLLKQLSSSEIIAKIKLLENESLRKMIIEKGILNSKRFSWDTMATQYWKIYQSLMSEIE